MKFGKQLQEELRAEWCKHYVDYKVLKKALKPEAPAVPAFFDLLKSEVQKVQSFIQQQHEALWKVMSAGFAGDFNNAAKQCEVFTVLETLVASIQHIHSFAALNQLALHKIIKKADKKLGQVNECFSPEWNLVPSAENIVVWLLVPAEKCLRLVTDCSKGGSQPLRQFHFWVQELRAGAVLARSQMTGAAGLNTMHLRLQLTCGKDVQCRIRNTFIDVAQKDEHRTRSSSLPPREELRAQGKELVPLEPRCVIDVPEAEEEEVSEEVAVDSESTESFPAAPPAWDEDETCLGLQDWKTRQVACSWSREVKPSASAAWDKGKGQSAVGACVALRTAAGRRGRVRRRAEAIFGGVWKGSWAQVLEDAAASLRPRLGKKERCSSAAPACVAFIGGGLVAEAGGMPEAADALAQRLRLPQLVACVVDGSIGHDLSRSKSRWPLRLFHRWLQILRQWTERRPPVRELESDMSLSLAFFNCRATPVVISTADLQAEEDLSLKSGKSGAGFKQVARGAPFGAELEKDISAAVILADGLEAAELAAARVAEAFPQAAQVGAVGAQLAGRKGRPTPCLAAIGADGGWPAGPCGSVRLAKGAVALLLRNVRLEAISCGGMRGLGPELNVTDLSKRDTVERFGDPAWPTIMKVFQQASLEEQLLLRSHSLVVSVRNPGEQQCQIRRLKHEPKESAVIIPGTDLRVGSKIQLLVRHQGVAEEDLTMLQDRLALERTVSPAPLLGCLVLADRARGQALFGREADGPVAAASGAAVCGCFCRGQLAVPSGVRPRSQRLSAVFGFFFEA
ncbi:unnamed protein product [Effrenium voratum]|uniref:SPX domain-containing protein n=1 Tax=Effrenium voratum TaxID=2562239 RepID=A0AA36HQR2_9DINO|nr:unnamed protein product [Effrenium voratum]